MAPHGHHAGDGRLPGEEAGRRERALHSAVDAGLPGEDATVSRSRLSSAVVVLTTCRPSRHRCSAFRTNWVDIRTLE